MWFTILTFLHPPYYSSVGSLVLRSVYRFPYAFYDVVAIERLRMTFCLVCKTDRNYYEADVVDMMTGSHHTSLRFPLVSDSFAFSNHRLLVTFFAHLFVFVFFKFQVLE